jgi:predicted protein tyrosine phosphatase
MGETRQTVALARSSDFLLIGSNSIAGQVERVRRAGITHIVKCTAQLMVALPGFTSLDIPMNDGGDENVISSIFRITVFIQKIVQANGRVLIHCAEDVSRSVAVVIGYFIITEKSDYQSVFKRIRESQIRTRNSARRNHSRDPHKNVLLFTEKVDTLHNN